MMREDFRRQMDGYGPAMAEIHYHLPDRPSLALLLGTRTRRSTPSVRIARLRLISRLNGDPSTG